MEAEGTASLYTLMDCCICRVWLGVAAAEEELKFRDPEASGVLATAVSVGYSWLV